MSKLPPHSSPGVRMFIPMLYVAWADRVLSPTEVKFLKKKSQELSFLSKDDMKILNDWSNPRNPPSPELFKLWELEMKKSVAELPADKRKTLIELGLEMAKQSVSFEDNDPELTGLFTGADTQSALADLEKHLGLINLETYHTIFPEKAKEFQQKEEECNLCFSIEKMQAHLDGKWADDIDRTKALLLDPAFKMETIRDKEEYRNRVLHWCKLLAKQGVGGMPYPEEFGGEGNMAKYVRVFETLGYHDLSMVIKFGVQFGLWGGSVANLGTEYHHKKYLPTTASLELAGCFAMTETGHGSNVRGLETTATYDPETQEFIVNTPDLHAGKEYIGNALHGQIASVFCQLIVGNENHGVHAVVVPMKDENGDYLPGVRTEDCGYKVGLNGIDNGRIWFDNVRVPRENLLDRFGHVSPEGVYSSPIENPSRRFFTMLGTLVGGRVCVPKAGLSATKKGLYIAIKYALKRRQFASGKSEQEMLLLDYPSHQRRLIPRLAKTYALHFALEHLADLYTSADEEGMREVETMAAGLKSYATWFTTSTLQECREACGGKGYLAENQFADMKADTDIFTTFEGDNTVLTQLAAKGVLTNFRKQISDDGMTGILRYVGKNIATAVAEKNPLTIRNTDEAHLLDPAFHAEAFQYRLDQQTYIVSQKIRSKIKSGMNSADAFLQLQNRILQLGEAYTENLVLTQFHAAIDRADDSLKPMLNDLCALYALHTLEGHKGWFLEEEYFASTKTKHISRQVQSLCAKIRKDAGALVDAFGIPSGLVNAQIVD